MNKESFLENLDNIYRECSVYNWDKNESKPINKKQYLIAKDFFENFNSLDFPIIKCNFNGDIYFEWYKNSNLFLIIFISENPAFYIMNNEFYTIILHNITNYIYEIVYNILKEK